jgi:hypothetical protein
MMGYHRWSLKSGIMRSYQVSKKLGACQKLTANKKLATGWVLIGVVALEKGFIYALALPDRGSSHAAVLSDAGQKEVHWLLR